MHWKIMPGAQRLKDCPKNEQLARLKRIFDGNCEILRLSFDRGRYLTIRRRARGFYRLIVGEGRSPEPTIKGDRNRERAV